MPLPDSLKKRIRTEPVVKEPLWKGPEVDGVTQSMLGRFLVCRERFRVHAIEGLRPHPCFEHRSAYGDMWHVCEECHARGDSHAGPLMAHVTALRDRFPQSIKEIGHWYRVCQAQFPLYVRYWQDQTETLQRTPLYQEQVFKVPYTLPSGRKVFLRGKFDSVDLVVQGGRKVVYLQENKTKGDIRQLQIERQLSFDLQTCMYLVALRALLEHTRVDVPPIGGVRYNVVRRPLSGGEGTIRQHKPSKSNPRGETAEHFYARVRDLIAENPGSYFMRWDVPVSQEDIDRFEHRCLQPILEELCDWYERMVDCLTIGRDPFLGPQGIHWQHPFGCWNALNEGGSTDLDDYLATGNKVGLVRAGSLFGELE